MTLHVAHYNRGGGAEEVLQGILGYALQTAGLFLQAIPQGNDLVYVTKCKKKMKRIQVTSNRVFVVVVFSFCYLKFQDVSESQ